MGLSVDSIGVYDIGRTQPFIDSLPPSECRHGMLLVYNLVQLSDFVSDFAAAVALLDRVKIDHNDVQMLRAQSPVEYGRIRSALSHWSDMAGRDAAMTIFHFGKALPSIRRCLKDLPTVKANVNHRALRAAAESFRRAFPDFEIMRHAIAHRAENTATLEEVEKHLCEGTFRFGKLKDGVYAATHQGKHCRLSVDGDARRRLAGVVIEVFAAFPELTTKLPPVNI